MTDLRVVGGEELAAELPWPDVIDALEDLFGRARAPTAPPRQHLTTDTGDLLLMPAWDGDVLGVKLVTVASGNPARGLPLIHGVYVLFDARTMEPRIGLDASALTALRTAGVSAVATRHLARGDPARLVIFGAGVQARSHLLALPHVLDVEEIVVVGRSETRAEELVAEARASGLDVRVGAPEAVRDADVVCTCTTSSTPLFHGTDLQDGAFVIAVGSYRPDARELDDATVAGADLVVVDTRVALDESGDLIDPVREGVLDPAVVVDLAGVIGGRVPRPDGTVIFKSVGAAAEDLAVASLAAARLVG